MGKPYSMDLRERAVAGVLRDGLSEASVGGAIWDCAEHGDQLGPACSGDGERRARPDGGRKPKAIAGEHALFLARRVGEGGFTLRGLVAELAERGLKVDYRSVWNFVHAERLSFKKNRRRQRTRPT
jgi:putative transposase